MISTRDFLALTGLGDGHFQLPVGEHATGGGGHRSLFGGVGAAAGIVALETVSGRPTIWATAQYLSRLGSGSVLDLHVDIEANGRSISQGLVRGRHDNSSVITLIGATGRRPGRPTDSAIVFKPRPDAPQPHRCDLVPRHEDVVSVHTHVELRLASGMFGFSAQGRASGRGHTLLWARMPEVLLDAASVALMADYMASAVGDALEREAHCTSLDNTIRFTAPIEPGSSDWILCDTQVDFTDGGIAHATSHIWNETGALIAISSQSMAVTSPPAG
ncbi:MAG: acyl-CoA thioesterase [Acidimicrobiia bacterium]